MTGMQINCFGTCAGVLEQISGISATQWQILYYGPRGRRGGGSQSSCLECRIEVRKDLSY